MLFIAYNVSLLCGRFYENPIPSLHNEGDKISREFVHMVNIGLVRE